VLQGFTKGGKPHAEMPPFRLRNAVFCNAESGLLQLSQLRPATVRQADGITINRYFALKM